MLLCLAIFRYVFFFFAIFLYFGTRSMKGLLMKGPGLTNDLWGQDGCFVSIMVVVWFLHAYPAVEYHAVVS